MGSGGLPPPSSPVVSPSAALSMSPLVPIPAVSGTEAAKNPTTNPPIPGSPTSSNAMAPSFIPSNSMALPGVPMATSSTPSPNMPFSSMPSPNIPSPLSPSSVNSPSTTIVTPPSFSGSPGGSSMSAPIQASPSTGSPTTLLVSSTLISDSVLPPIAPSTVSNYLAQPSMAFPETSNQNFTTGNSTRTGLAPLASYTGMSPNSAVSKVVNSFCALLLAVVCGVFVML
ncbi:hypothetical protein BZA77DRAFT_351610 [Pyronema omphalodes]|nr:hypothetical protein BZA77DRAFT_351610 [Pyronema omphalodes]